MRESSADGLHLGGVFSDRRRQHHAAGNQDARQVRRPRQGHHHRGQTFITSRDAQDALPSRQGPDQPPKNLSRVIAVSQAVHHAGRPLGSSITGIGAKAREWNTARSLQLFRGGFHEQADFPVARVVAKRHRRAVRGADAALRAKDEELFAIQLGGIPAHADILAHAK